jgi:hypothetical protein
VVDRRTLARRRRASYVCGYHRDRGETVCTNDLMAPMVETDTAVLGALSRELFHPDVVDGLVETFMAALAQSDGGRAER